MSLFIGIVCLVLGFLFGLSIKFKQREDLDLDTKRKNQELLLEKEKLETKIDLSLARIQELANQEQDKREQLEEQTNTIIQNAKQNAKILQDSEMEKVKSLITAEREKFETERQLRTEQEEEKLKQNLEVIRKQLDEEKSKLYQSKDNLILEISDLENKRNALVESFRREREVKEKETYYCLQLSSYALADIKVLHSIEHLLHNKEPLYKLIWSSYYQPAFKEMSKRVLGVNKVGGIYKITNKENGYIYIGQSTSISDRWSQHIKSSLEIGTIAKTQLYTAMKENGAESYTFELLEECDKSKLNEREKYYINLYKSNEIGYNMTGGGS